MSAAVEMRNMSVRRRLCRDPNQPKPRACRNLFGIPDKIEIDRLLQTELSKSEEEDITKYNFNFHSDSPFEGKYEWEICDPRDIPAFYRPVTVSQSKRIPQIPSPSIASGASEYKPVQSTSTDVATNTNIPHFNARLHRFSSKSEKAITTTSSSHASGTNTRTQIGESKTLKPSVSCAISTKGMKRPTECKRRRPVTSTVSTSTEKQPKITDFLQQRKRPACAFTTKSESKRRKVSSETINSRTASPETISAETPSSS